MACEYIYNSTYQGKVSDYRRKHGTAAIEVNSLHFGGLNAEQCSIAQLLSIFSINSVIFF